MAVAVTGVRVVFFGSHRQPSYVVETCAVPNEHDLADGEILVKILMTTICPMDIDHIDGRKEVKTPCVLGHEGVGEVLISRRTFNGFPAVSPGDRVSFTMVNKCGCCCMCKYEMRDCSSSKDKMGYLLLKDFSGSYSTHMVLKPNTQIVRIPSNVANSIASPANCALATIVHAVSFVTSAINLRHAVAVIQGANLMGLYGCALLYEAGFQHVYCHDVEAEKLLLVPKFGGIPVLVEKEYDFEELSCDPGCSAVDVVIDVCGGWDVVPYGLNMLRHQGMYVFVGSAHDNRPLELNIDTLLNKCVTVKGIQGYKSIHLEKGMEFLSKTVDRYPYETLVSPPHSLQDFHNAVREARNSRYYRTAIVP